MEKILKFNQFILESNTPLLHDNDIINLKFTDENGVSIAICQLIEFGWGVNRKKLYHRFKILKTNNNDKYPIGSEFDLHMDFNEKHNNFLFYPHYNDKYPNLKKMEEKTYSAYIKIIK